MATLINKQQHLVSRPEGEPTLENFQLVKAPVPELLSGQVLVRHHYLSLDPYMRGRMNDGKSYAEPQPLNQVMVGGTVGEVMDSRSDHFVVGDKVAGMGGWQQYQVVDATQAPGLRKIDRPRAPLSAYLGVLGAPGVTAWHGIERIIRPKSGETVVVSAASGAVGGVVGQLARIRGARAVGLAGGPKKCQYVVEELGFDACVDYRQYPDVRPLTAALRNACPNGIDGYFENVGGLILDAVLLLSNDFSRIAMCGMIAGYNGQPIPLTTPQLILTHRIRIEGFIIGDHRDEWPVALSELATLFAAGRLKFRETVAQGIEAAPEAFLGLLKGHNIGKQLVRLI